MTSSFIVRCTFLCFAILLCVELISAGGAITSDLWINAPTPSDPPLARHSHSSLFYPFGKSMIVFGGCGADGKSRNDVSTYTVDTDAWMTDVVVSGDVPPTMFGHSAVLSDLHTMLVFGGKNGTLFYNSVYTYDMKTSSWSLRNTSGDVPSPRAYHTAVVDYNFRYMYVYGGTDDDTVGPTTSVGWPLGNVFDDLYVLDLASYTWNYVNVTSSMNANANANMTNYIPPLSRACHTSVMTQVGVMVSFGGIGIDDLSCYSIANKTWYSCVTQASPAPSVRYGHTALFSPLQQMVVYGGRNSAGNPVSDVWNFDLTTWQWEVVLPGGAPINPRGFHTATSTTFGSMIVFGGIDGDGMTTNDFGLYNVASTVLRSANDGVVLVVLVTLLGTILLVMCFTLDYLQEQNAIEMDEAVAKAKSEKQKQEDALLIPKLPAIPKALQIPLGPRAQRFFDEIKMSMDPMQEPK